MGGQVLSMYYAIATYMETGLTTSNLNEMHVAVCEQIRRVIQLENILKHGQLNHRQPA